MSEWLAAQVLHGSAVAWVALTALIYLLAQQLYVRGGSRPVLIPVLTGVLMVVGVLTCCGVPYDEYYRGVAFLNTLIGPVTVALAVPLYAQWSRLRKLWLPITLAVLVGGSVGILSAVGIGWLFSGSMEILMSVAPKSATIPIATAVSAEFGGVASLAAVAVAITGIVGVIVADPVLRVLRIDDAATRGVAMGLTAHAIGTAREIQRSAESAGFAALAMALNGIATALLMPVLVSLMR
ncbi:MAG: LrgB family protein [Comamonas sp.]